MWGLALSCRMSGGGWARCRVVGQETTFSSTFGTGTCICWSCAAACWAPPAQPSGIICTYFSRIWCIQQAPASETALPLPSCWPRRQVAPAPVGLTSQACWQRQRPLAIGCTHALLGGTATVGLGRWGSAGIDISLLVAAGTGARGAADQGAGGASAYICGSRRHAARLSAGVRQRRVSINMY